jgi:phosphatidate cytidylyltransferase
MIHTTPSSTRMDVHDASAELVEPDVQRKRSWSDEMSRRIRTIAVGLPVILVIVFVGTPLVEIGMLIVGILAAAEIAHMIQPGSRMAAGLSIVAAIVAMLGIMLNQYALIVGAVVFVLIGGRLSIQHLPMPTARHIIYLAMGVLYVAIPLALLPHIRNTSHGLAWTIFLLFTTWTTDTLALLGGRQWGKHKLAPTISPAKTLEGALVGYGCGVAMGLVVALAAMLPVVPALVGMALLPLLVICGDLVESWTKRSFAVKDSGSLLPGHGGFFDRVDGLILATPVLYFLMMLAGLL